MPHSAGVPANEGGGSMPWMTAVARLQWTDHLPHSMTLVLKQYLHGLMIHL